MEQQTLLLNVQVL